MRSRSDPQGALDPHTLCGAADFPQGATASHRDPGWRLARRIAGRRLLRRDVSDLRDTNDADPQLEIVDQWADAFLDGDPDAVAALFTEDGTYEERGPSQVFEGRSAIRQQLDEAFQYAEATEMTPKTIITGDSVISGSRDVITVEWTMSGMSAPGARSPADRTPFSVEAVTVFEMRDGLIAESVFYAPWSDLFN
ncbi:MAG: nuclear transport factor 2 family protein [bacterium]|nr:nuclear transport factor 2 family protein [bacterium]